MGKAGRQLIEKGNIDYVEAGLTDREKLNTMEERNS